MTRYRIERQQHSEINTDPQRRCYYGVHANSEWNYWFSGYGRIGNRPLSEIRPLANEDLLTKAGYREYADNSANRQLGFVDGQRAMLLADIDAQTVSEVSFAWRLEMILAEVNKKLLRIQEGILK